MAKFTAAEVQALQAGGNERARQIFFRSLDPARVAFPDSGSPEKLRDFIRRVYEKRLYVGDRPPSAQQEEAVTEARRPDQLKQESRTTDLRSLSFDDHVGKQDSFNRRKSDFSSMGNSNRGGGGSPKTVGSPQQPPRPTRGHSYDERDEQSPKTSNGNRERRVLSRPFSFRDFDVTPPPAQNITDILGDIPGLRVEVFRHPNGDSPDSSARSSVDSTRRAMQGDLTTRKAFQSQSFGAVGDDRVAPMAASDHKRASSTSLIDINGDTGSSRRDPFAAETTSPANSDSWATFNTSPSPPPPAGYPAAAPKTELQWADSGWGSTTTTSTLDTWSSFGTPSPPKAVQNAIPSSGLQSTSSPVQPSRVRRQLPQNFYAPSIEDHLPNLNVHQQQQMQPVFRPPQLDAPMEDYYNLGLQNSQTQLFQGQEHTPALFQPHLQPQQALELSHLHQQQPSQAPPVQRSRNPFDDDFEDEPPASLASTGLNMQFPSMDALQAALPPVSSGVPALEAAAATTLPSSGASSDWAYSFTPFNDSTSSSGSFNFSSEQGVPSFQTSFPVQPNVSSGYMSTHAFNQEAAYPGNQLNFVRPAGGNPFG